MRTFREYVETVNNDKSIKSLIDSESLICFFKFGKDYFGCPEESRVVLARMKNPSEDNPAVWRKEAGFTAINLSKAVKSGERTEQMFEFKDLKNIKITPKDEVIKTLEKGIVKTPEVFVINHDDNIPGDNTPGNMGNLEDDK